MVRRFESIMGHLPGASVRWRPVFGATRQIRASLARLDATMDQANRGAFVAGAVKMSFPGSRISLRSCGLRLSKAVRDSLRKQPSQNFPRHVKRGHAAEQR